MQAKQKKILIIVIAVVIILLVSVALYKIQASRMNTIEILDVKKDHSIESMETEIIKNENIIHFSVDDIFQSFVNLNENSYKSIFEEEHFGFLKELHDKYGAVISCYVFFENEEFNLHDITDKYANEFKENADWLKFGFHSLNKHTNYADTTKNEISVDYAKTIRELERITGSNKSIDSTIRLHNYAANDDAVAELVKIGVESLLGPEDKRLAYNLNQEETSYLFRYDYFNSNHMNYFKTDVRIENLKDLNKFYGDFAKDFETNTTLIIFTHEQRLREIEMQQKINELFELVAKQYKFDFIRKQ